MSELTVETLTALEAKFPVLENLRRVVVAAGETLDTIYADNPVPIKMSSPRAYAALKDACHAFDIAADGYNTIARILADLD